MSDEKPKKVSSIPPPPTDAVDQSWSNTPAPGGVVDAKKAPTSTAVSPGPSVADIQRKAREQAAEEDEFEDEDEDEESEDQDEDEDDEEADEAPARPLSHSARPTSSSDWLPDWAPWAVLGGLVLIGIVGGLGGLGAAAPRSRPASEAPATPAKAAATARTQPTAARPASAGTAAAADTETIEASHLLVAYQGARRADPKVTRTKEEAKKRAEEAAAKAKKGAAFDKLVAEYSDEPRAAERKGALGSFSRRQMVKPFADAAFALKPGQISDVVETDFGYHVILRSK